MRRTLRYVALDGIRKIAQADDFEQKLAQIADAEISQTIPALSDHKVGFQVIDKNDEETRGVGVMVYRRQGQWLYVPVFFLNGRLRGYDMMYLPDKQQFIPTKDNWLSYIGTRRPLDMGQPADTSKTDPKKPSMVHLEDHEGSSIILKRASLLKDLGLGGLCTFKGYSADAFDLKRWVPRLGKQAAVKLMRTLNNDPDFANAVLKYYDPSDVEGMVKQAAEDDPGSGGYPLKVRQGGETSEKLVLITEDTPVDTKADLDDSAKEILMRDGVFVIDERKDTSTVFQPRDVSGCLTSPKENGYYEILMADGSFKQFYVTTKVEAYKEDRKKGTSAYYLIPAGGTNAKVVRETLFAKRTTGKDPADISALGMSPKSFVRTARDHFGPYLVIDKKGNTAVVHVNSHSVSLQGNTLRGAYQFTGEECGLEKVVIQLTGLDGSLYKKARCLHVPSGARIIRIKDDRDSYIFGDLDTVRFEIRKSAALQPMKVYTDGLQWHIDGAFGSEKGLSKVAALISLVKKHRIHAPTAKAMLSKKASLKRPTAERYIVKYAVSLAGLMPESPQLSPEESINTVETEEMDPGMGADVVEQAVKASEAGIKDVMDVSILRALAMSGNSGRLVNDYISDLLLGLDRVGRILFMFYWHNDDFKQRYGSERLMELEDSLRNEFQGLSDLILFLHKSSVRQSMDIFGEELAGNIG